MLTAKVFDHKKKTTASAVGVDKKRAMEIGQKIKKSVNGNTHSEVLEFIVHEAQNVNEAVFLSFVYGRYVEGREVKQELLASLLEGLAKGLEK